MYKTRAVWRDSTPDAFLRGELPQVIVPEQSFSLTLPLRPIAGPKSLGAPAQPRIFNVFNPAIAPAPKWLCPRCKYVVAVRVDPLHQCNASSPLMPTPQQPGRRAKPIATGAWFKGTAIVVLDKSLATVAWTWLLARPEDQLSLLHNQSRWYVRPGVSDDFLPPWGKPAYDARLLNLGAYAGPSLSPPVAIFSPLIAFRRAWRLRVCAACVWRLHALRAWSSNVCGVRTGRSCVAPTRASHPPGVLCCHVSFLPPVIRVYSEASPNPVRVHADGHHLFATYNCKACTFSVAQLELTGRNTSDGGITSLRAWSTRRFRAFPAWAQGRNQALFAGAPPNEWAASARLAAAGGGTSVATSIAMAPPPPPVPPPALLVQPWLGLVATFGVPVFRTQYVPKCYASQSEWWGRATIREAIDRYGGRVKALRLWGTTTCGPQAIGLPLNATVIDARDGGRQWHRWRRRMERGARAALAQRKREAREAARMRHRAELEHPWGSHATSNGSGAPVYAQHDGEVPGAPPSGASQSTLRTARDVADAVEASADSRAGGVLAYAEHGQLRSADALTMGGPPQLGFGALELLANHTALERRRRTFKLGKRHRVSPTANLIRVMRVLAGGGNGSCEALLGIGHTHRGTGSLEKKSLRMSAERRADYSAGGTSNHGMVQGGATEGGSGRSRGLRMGARAGKGGGRRSGKGGGGGFGKGGGRGAAAGGRSRGRGRRLRWDHSSHPGKGGEEAANAPSEAALGIRREQPSGRRLHQAVGVEATTTTTREASARVRRLSTSPADASAPLTEPFQFGYRTLSTHAECCPRDA